MTGAAPIVVWRLIGLSLLAALPVLMESGIGAHAATPVIQGDCTLSWLPNTETDLAGYRLYLGRLASQLTHMKDVGNRTTVRCSEAQAVANGRWFAAVAAYDTSGNESALTPILPFELAGLVEPASPPVVQEPALVNLVPRMQGVQLTWTDRNQPPAAHRIEVSSSRQSGWSTAAVLPPGVARFGYFQPGDAAWVCYRIRAESGPATSQWAQATGPADRQFCYTPTPVSLIEQPIVASSVLFEPQSVRLTQTQQGFELSWAGTAGSTVSHRIEVSGSVDPRWTSLVVLPPGMAKYTYSLPLDASWACVRIRAEVGRFVSLWAMAGGPNDRQFCYAPGL